MSPSPSTHLVRRWSKRVQPLNTLDRLVEALKTLLLVTSREDPFFLSRGLELLRENLGADLAYLVTLEGKVGDTQWWVPETPDSGPPPPVPQFCNFLLENPFRTLVLRNVAESPQVPGHLDIAAQGIAAAAGTVLWGDGVIKALLFVHFNSPQPLERPELALLDSVAGFLARVLEVENLKFSLRRLEDALAITRAVVEDSSIQDTQTKLPNLRYLEIWLQANLSGAARDREVMTLATWHLDLGDPDALGRLRAAAEQVRGGDLLVSGGHGRFLLILQRTPKGLGHIFLLRIRAKLGEVAMGATVWMPARDDNRLEAARQRMDSALVEAQATGDAPLVWNLLQETEA